MSPKDLKMQQKEHWAIIVKNEALPFQASRTHFRAIIWSHSISKVLSTTHLIKCLSTQLLYCKMNRIISLRPNFKFIRFKSVMQVSFLQQTWRTFFFWKKALSEFKYTKLSTRWTQLVENYLKSTNSVPHYAKKREKR